MELYLGEVIGPEEATRRADIGDLKGTSYLFDLDKFGEERGASITYTIDGEYCGSVARFINHSCDPNLVTFAVMSDRRDGLVYNLALFTARRVKAFEELTFSYIGDDHHGLGHDVNFGEMRECLCGARKCRGWLW